MGVDFGGDLRGLKRSIGKFLRSLKVKLGPKAVICAVLLIAINTVLVVGAAYWSLTSEFADRALRDIEINLRTLALTFAEIYGDAKITMKDGVVTRAEISRDARVQGSCNRRSRRVLSRRQCDAVRL